MKPSFALPCLALLFAWPAEGAVFCVATSEALQHALGVASMNGEDDSIRIRAGSYPAPPGGFRYLAQTLVGGDDRALTLSGGWQSLAGNGCGHVPVEDPWLTLLTGPTNGRVLDVQVRANSAVTVRLLSFASGRAPPTQTGGGLRISGPETGLLASVTVERNVFFANESWYGGGLAAENVSSGPLLLRVVNNLFLANHAGQSAGAALLQRSGGAIVYFTNNTVLGNTSGGSSPSSTGGVLVLGQAQRFIANNNFWNNTGRDLHTQGGSIHYTLRNNNIAAFGGDFPHLAEHNLSVTPEFQPGLFNFTPVRSSPLVDAGVHPGGITGWYLTGRDLAAGPRLVASVDIGAFENERVFRHGFQPAGPFGDQEPATATGLRPPGLP